MKEQVISFETAKLAKEKEFDWKSTIGYKENGESMTIDRSEVSFFAGASINFNNTDLIKYNKQFTDDWVCVCVAPTQSLLQKWLREKHNIYVEVTHSYRDLSHYTYHVYTTWDEYCEKITMAMNNELHHFSVYEDALEAGLQAGINRIKINIV